MSSINYNMRVPSFKGTDSEDVSMWFSSFTSVMSLNGINERNPLIFYYFRSALSDAALYWLCKFINQYEKNCQVLITMACNNLGLLSSCLLPVEELKRIEEQAKPLILKDFGKLKETFIKRFAPKICSSIAELSLINNRENQCNSIIELNEVQLYGNNSSVSSSQSAVEENSTEPVIAQLQQDPAASGTVSLGAQSPVMAPSASPSMNGRDNNINLSSNASITKHSQEMVLASANSVVIQFVICTTFKVQAHCLMHINKCEDDRYVLMKMMISNYKLTLDNIRTLV